MDNYIMTEILSILWSLLVLFLWFDTNVFHEYFHRILFLRKLFKFDEYDKNKEYYGHCSYQDFLPIQYNNFFVKLISCPYCLGFWTSLASTYFLTEMKIFPMTYFGSVIGYFSVHKLFDYFNNSQESS